MKYRNPGRVAAAGETWMVGSGKSMEITACVLVQRVQRSVVNECTQRRGHVLHSVQ